MLNHEDILVKTMEMSERMRGVRSEAFANKLKGFISFCSALLMLTSCVEDYEIDVAKYQVRNDLKDTVYVVIHGGIWHEDKLYGRDRTIDFAREVAPGEEKIFGTSYDDDDDSWDMVWGWNTGKRELEALDSIVVYTSSARDSCLFREDFFTRNGSSYGESNTKDALFYTSEFWSDVTWTVSAGGGETYRYNSYTFIINDALIARKEGEE